MEKIWGFHDLKPGQGCNFSKLFYPEDFDADMQNGLRGWDIFWGEGDGVKQLSGWGNGLWRVGERKKEGEGARPEKGQK